MALENPETEEIEAPATDSFSIFEAARGEKSDAVIELPKEEEPDGDPVEVEDIEEGQEVPAKEEKPDNEEIDLEEVQPVTPVKKERVARDYNGFEPKEVEMLKKCGNDTFTEFSRLLKEEKTRKANPPKTVEANPHNLPAAYFEHPEAYILSPDYSRTLNTVQRIDSIKDHYIRQKRNIDKNGKFVEIQKNNNGEIITLPEREATDDDAVNVEKYIDFMNTQGQKAKNDLEKIVTTFKDKHQGDIKSIQEAENNFFPGFDDPKHETVEIQKKVKEAMPSSFRDNPVTKLLAKSIGANALMLKKLQASEAENRRLKGTAKDAKNAPPKKGNFVAGKSGKVNGIDSFAAFEAARKETLQ